MTDIPSHPEPELKTVVTLYLIFALGLFLTFFPYALAAAGALILVLGVMMAAYSLRKRHAPGGYVENHMTYIIRTIWIGSLYSVVTLGLGSAYLLTFINNAPLQPCIDRILDMEGNPAAVADPVALYAGFEGCYSTFVSLNMAIFVIGGLIAMGPLILFFFARGWHGYQRARKSYRVANVKSWV